MTILPEACSGVQLVGVSGEEGAGPSLTLPQNSHSPLEGKVWGSEDYTTCNVFGEVCESEVRFAELLIALEEAKERAKASKSGVAPFFWNEGAWLIRGGGARAGGKNGIGFDYVLEGGGLIWMLNKHRYPAGYNFNCRCLASSEVLMEYDGLVRAHPVMREGWRQLEVRILEETISRVDIAVDLPIALEEVENLVLSGAFIHRFKHSTIHMKRDSKWEGITFGKGDIVLRIYDKRSELFQKRSVRKLAIMNERRYGWSDDGPCLRVEWQIRGEALKKWDSQEVAKYLQKRAAICEYLNTKHTRCADGAVTDKSHTSRVKAGQFWEEVVCAFRQVCAGGRTVEPLMPTPRFGATVQSLMKQVVGCLITAVSIDLGQGDLPSEELTKLSVAKAIRDLLSVATNGVNLVSEINQRIAQIAISVPTSPIWFQEDGKRPIPLPT